jgi:genome maintenance exonuclease 1
MIINKFNYTPLSRTTLDGKRHYSLPDGTAVPSVTTILDKTKTEESKAALAAWRARVGQEKAQQITTEAANRGTRMHTYLERYVKNGDVGPIPGNPFALPSWLMAHTVVEKGLKNVTEFYGVEVPLYYSGLYAGTTDCIGQWGDKIAILDFKQSNKVKKREWIEDYFLQLAAYALAHDNMHGTAINHAVILMCVQPKDEDTEPEYLEFEVGGSEFDTWKNNWWNRVEQYYAS